MYIKVVTTLLFFICLSVASYAIYDKEYHFAVLFGGITLWSLVLMIIAEMRDKE